MTSSSDSAEQLVKIYLDGVEVALKISGQATQHIIASLYAISKDKNRTRGKIRLGSMIKTGKELKIFSINKEDLKLFSQQAKKYGVLYCALVDKIGTKKDGIVDIMVRAEDAPKINRIVERYDLKANVSSAEVAEQIELEKEKKKGELDNSNKSPEDLLVADLLSKPEPEAEKQIINDSPSFSKSDKENPLENSSKNKEIVKELLNPTKKPSVREELKEIEQEMEKELQLTGKQEKTISKEIKHQQVKKKARKKRYMKRGRHFETPKHLKNTERGK